MQLKLSSKSKKIFLATTCLGLLAGCPDIEEQVFTTKVLSESLPQEIKNQLNFANFPDKLTIMKLDLDFDDDDEVFFQTKTNENQSTWTIFQLKNRQYKKIYEDIVLPKNLTVNEITYFLQKTLVKK